MNLRALKTAKIKKGTWAIVRVDFNEPLKNGKLADDYRIKVTLPTINYLLRKGCNLVLISHLGRPDGRRKKEFSLAPVARRLARLLKEEVRLVNNPFIAKDWGCCDEYCGRDCLKKNHPRVYMLENIRFWPEEEKNDKKFARRIAAFGDIYVNDAFGASHRAHASVSELPRILPCYAGFLLEKEILALEKLLYSRRRPFFAVLAGGKASTKMDLVRKFLKEADGVLVGGAIANTVLGARGFVIGKSFADKNFENIRQFIDISSDKLFSPLDAVVSRRIDGRAASSVKLMSNIRPDEYIVDIGPKTSRFYNRTLGRAKTILWNGPVGIIEVPKFSLGTLDLIKAMKKIKAYKVTGGGDTITFLKKHGFMKVFDHVSTGGGAMLEFLAGKKLPGVEAVRLKVKVKNEK